MYATRVEEEESYISTEGEIMTGGGLILIIHPHLRDESL